MKISELKNLSEERLPELILTKIRTREINKLIELVDSFRDSLYEKLPSLLEDGSDEELTSAFNSVANKDRLLFSMYSLVIIHCYAILENNRASIIKKHIPSVKKRNMSKIDCVDCMLLTNGIYHNDVYGYAEMDEFRSVNNKIKHSRSSLSVRVKLEDGKEYSWEDLRSLYFEKISEIEKYLSDLYLKLEGLKIQSVNLNKCTSWLL